MKAVRTGASPSTLEALEYVDLPDAPAPGPGEIMVAVKASSLNYHDYAVVKGMLPTAQGRIPMSDGAGEVIAVGPGARDEAGKLVPLDVKKGDKVLFGKWSGTEVKIDGKELLIMKESDIMGVLDVPAGAKKIDKPKVVSAQGKNPPKKKAPAKE